MPSGEDDVLRFHIAVHQPLPVRVVKRVGDFAHDPDRVLDGELALAQEPLPERFPREEGHDVVKEAVGFAGVEERNDVRV